MRLSKKLLHAFCVRLKVLVPFVSIALAETVLSAQAAQPTNSTVAQVVHADISKIAVNQALRVKSPKISTVWKKK